MREPIRLKVISAAAREQVGMTIADSALDDLPPLSLAQVQPLIQHGDLLLCSGTAVFSKLIRWATKSPWSHVAMVMRADPIGRIMVLESVEKIGVRTVPLATFLGGPDGKHPYPGRVLVARNRNLNAQDRAAITQIAAFAVDQLGDPFAARDILKIAARIAFGSTNRKTPSMLTARGEYICSEYIAKCYDAIGVHVPWDGRGFIAPCDFAADPAISAVAQLQPPKV